MKTTIDIASNILQHTRDVARREGTTIRELVEEGLEMVLEKRATRKKKPIRPVTVGGHGLRTEFQDADWAKIRDAVYKGRGA